MVVVFHLVHIFVLFRFIACILGGPFGLQLTYSIILLLELSNFNLPLWIVFIVVEHLGIFHPVVLFVSLYFYQSGESQSSCRTLISVIPFCWDSYCVLTLGVSESFIPNSVSIKSQKHKRCEILTWAVEKTSWSGFKTSPSMFKKRYSPNNVGAVHSSLN